MQTYNRGSAVLTEIETKKYTAFGSYDYFDPTTATITVTDIGNNAKVDKVALTKSATGKYYYITQTLENWAIGKYEIKIIASDNINNDVTIYENAFTLK